MKRLATLVFAAVLCSVSAASAETCYEVKNYNFSSSTNDSARTLLQCWVQSMPDFTWSCTQYSCKSNKYPEWKYTADGSVCSDGMCRNTVRNASGGIVMTAYHPLSNQGSVLDAYDWQGQHWRCSLVRVNNVLQTKMCRL